MIVPTNVFDDESWPPPPSHQTRYDRYDPDRCPYTKDGHHVLDRKTVVACDEYDDLVVDVWCARCGRSGSAKIKAEEVMW